MKNIFSRLPSDTHHRLIILIIFILLFFLFQFVTGDTEHAGAEYVMNSPVMDKPVSFSSQVKPILDKRCVVCHSCYDAPCQLKLSSAEGLLRGASKEPVYNPRRVVAAEPTRLFIDANSESEWRQKGFYSVLEGSAVDKNEALLGLFLRLKQLHPQADRGKLSDTFTLGLNREQQCPDVDSFDDFADEYPLWGMPYAMPNLTQHENNILFSWLKQGAPLSLADNSFRQAAPQIIKWETFFNQASKKQQLVSRYLYEHLFQAHIHFENTPLNEFYRLVRSKNLSGPVDEIATLRPYDDPGQQKFYYRLRPYTPTIVAKNHIVYELSDARMRRYRQLFMQPDYKVDRLPSYSAEIASNPFKAFADIPPDSRYRFMLDDARFFIEGFIKGPVCRGQVALNVIEDQFWVAFFNPDEKMFTTQPEFLKNMSDYLSIPSERGSHMNLLAIWTDYWQRQKQYMASKQRYFENMHKHDLNHAMKYIWNGNGHNPNAALTVFRHFDSASVEYGFVGAPPETAWIIDYPLFERIHYLLVAGFNVYGNVVHQLSTRIYMDFLRMEGEDHFLALLPVKKRKAIRDQWYQGMRSELDDLFSAPMKWLSVETVTGYKTDDVQAELYQYLSDRLDSALEEANDINQCGHISCSKQALNNKKQKIDAAMKKLMELKGRQLHLFPEVSFVRVITDDNKASFAYTMMRNKAYKNVTSMLSDERKRDQQDIDKDTLTVVDWLLGNYPNFFFVVHEKDLYEFVEHCHTYRGQDDFDALIERYGIRRTNTDFWGTADWFQDQYKIQRPLHSGLFDLSRYSNL